MRLSTLLIFLVFTTVSFAQEDNRYLNEEKVVYETPQEQDVLRINTAMGFCTVLEFPDKPSMVTVGDNTLLQIEVPKNSKSVVIKPLEDIGTTNLFVFTPNKRFNYQVVIGEESQVDYVIDSKKAGAQVTTKKEKVQVTELIKMARNYPVLKELRNINKRNLVRKALFYQCQSPKLKIDVIEAFTFKESNYLILHIVLHNIAAETLNLNEKKTYLYVNDRKIVPDYVLFDDRRLTPNKNAEVWLALENSYISAENKFIFGIGVGNEEDICH